MNLNHIALMEFHISRRARDRYQFDDRLFAISGNVIFANFHAARLFAQKMNARRDLISFPEQSIKAGQVNAMGLIDEILHLVAGLYRQQNQPKVMENALVWLEEKVGVDSLDATLRQFIEEFPPVAVYRRQMSIDEYLAGESVLPEEGTIANRQIVLEELLVLWLANANPAFAPYLELFDDQNLEKNTSYAQVISSLHDFFDRQPFFGPEHQNLIDLLRSPAIAVPHSLTGQLEFIQSHWGFWLGKYLYRLLSSLDLIREEEKMFFPGGAGISHVYDFTGMQLELERFSQDKDWMPSLVLLAKNIYVWLDQLSKKYRRPILHLDDVPDEELGMLARWGFSGLWLIGVWERSAASKTIKQLRGNPDAVASAYSLYSYEIAADLGGEEAYRGLRDRAWRFGIRLASDMVPNHMGIDSRWVVEHPDWFISLDYSPFPSYSYNGPNLSWDQRVGIFIDDHYFDNSDAAVAFKRVDFWSGDTKYIYHGNDGTSMPWNDTAQLNYLKAEVREAVIQTILEVAKKFPVIRFDAAMTLAKKHYQRLWFPEPGSGGDIPSRADHGLSKQHFNDAFPEEFWREVVDRVAQEAPDTLLLAEAFWLMEGYFVRTLGMHRVYNSAFMNMLRDEKNQEYRLVIKNTIEFDPEILKRYVNFMNNPDERTAVDQFGKGDKYFGICTMMATMPGLPMFGHGQVEGFTEKYGMEYHRAYWDERPDGYLVDRHEREIFPLLRKRYLFANVENFLMYDFYSTEGYVNEDVFAYSNRAGSERSLVIYHNKYAETHGWIRTSVAYSVKTGAGEERKLAQKDLGDGLALQREGEVYLIFRDQITGLEYIRNNQELHAKGLYLDLKAYQSIVFVDLREIKDDEWHHYAELTAFLDGRGVPSIEEALKEVFLQPVHRAFRELVNAGMFKWLIANRQTANRQTANRLTGLQPENPKLSAALDEAEWKTLNLFREIKHLVNGQGDEVALSKMVRRELEALLTLPNTPQQMALLSQDQASPKLDPALKYLHDGPDGQSAIEQENFSLWGIWLGWLFTHRLGEILNPQGDNDETAAVDQSRSWMDEWLLGKILSGVFKELDMEDALATRNVGVIKILIQHQSWRGKAEDEFNVLKAVNAWLSEWEIQNFLGINRYQGILWFNKDRFEELCWWLYAIQIIEILSQGDLSLPTDRPRIRQEMVEGFEIIRKLLQAEEQSAYQVDRLLSNLKLPGSLPVL